MLVYQLLFSFRINNDSKIIKRSNKSAKLETIHQINGDRHVLLPQMIQKRILNVDGICHDNTSSYSMFKPLEIANFQFDLRDC